MEENADKQTPIQLSFAPMRGVATMYYRRVFFAHFSGLDRQIAPFISTVSAERIHPKLLRDILPENNAGPPLVPQLIGNNADDFVRMSEGIRALGYTEINWNLGCPHKPIRKKQRGSGLLPHPDRVDRMLNEICTRSACRISVKVRLGVSSAEELERLIPVLNQYPLSEVIVHPRTAEQMYTGSVDLNAFEQLYPLFAHPVCYNGDICTPDFFETLQKHFPQISRFMIGRGLLENPFLCEQLRGLSVQSDPVKRIADFHNELLKVYENALDGDRPVLGKMKEFWTYLQIHLSNGSAMFKALKKAQRLDRYKSIIEGYLSSARWEVSEYKKAPPKGREKWSRRSESEH